MLDEEGEGAEEQQVEHDPPRRRVNCKDWCLATAYCVRGSACYSCNHYSPEEYDYRLTGKI